MARGFMHMYRRFYAALERLVPLKFLNLPSAVEGFKREEVDPCNITLESAQRALRESRARRAARETTPTDGANGVVASSR